MNHEKPFNTASIVVLMLVAGFSDLFDLFTGFIFLVPIIGQAVFLLNSLIVSPIVWAIIQLSFIMKTGMGRASLLAILGGLGNIANIPGSETITTAIAITVANNQAAAKITAVAGKKTSRGTAAERGAAKETEKGVEEAGLPAQAGARAAREREALSPAGRTPREAAGAGESEEETGSEAAGEKVSGEALGEYPTPFEELEKLTGPEVVLEDDEKNEVDLRKAA